MSSAAILGRYETGHQRGCRVVHIAAYTRAQRPFGCIVQPAIAKRSKRRYSPDRRQFNRQAARDNPPATGMARDFRCPIL
jgi:hypothetical protein